MRRLEMQKGKTVREGQRVSRGYARTAAQWARFDHQPRRKNWHRLLQRAHPKILTTPFEAWRYEQRFGGSMNFRMFCRLEFMKRIHGGRHGRRAED